MLSFFCFSLTVFPDVSFRRSDATDESFLDRITGFTGFKNS